MSLGYQKMNKLLRFHLMMGLQCNARCIMCYQTDYSARYNMPSSIYADHLLNIYPYIQSVKIQGGEPTIMSNCREFSQLARSFPNMKLSITTNGICIDDFWMEVFLKQCGSINFSINAASEITYNRIIRYGNFRRVINSIKVLIAQRKSNTAFVSISAVVLKENIEELSDFVYLGKDLGVDLIDFIIDPFLVIKKIPEDIVTSSLPKIRLALEHCGIKSSGLNSLEKCFNVSSLPLKSSHRAKDEKRAICPMPFTNLVINYNGDVRVCCDTWRIIGNTYKTGIDKILAGKYRQVFQRRIKVCDYSWCNSYCSDNAFPTKKAIIDKAFYRLAKNPFKVMKQISHKLIQRQTST